MKFSNDGTNWSAAEPYAASKTWELSSGEGSKTVYIMLIDNAGRTSTYSDTVFLDVNVPSGTININGGANATTSTAATLTLSCDDGIGSGCAEVSLSNDGSNWTTEAYASSKAWTLPSGDGTKTVYGKFKDNSGKWSDYFTDTIILDTTAPITSASPTGGLYNTAQLVVLICDDGSGSGCDKTYYTTDGGTPTTASNVYSSPIAINTTTTLKFFSKNNAGVNETIRTETYNIDTAAPSSTITAPGSGLTLDHLYLINGTASDAGSGLQKVELQVTGGAWYLTSTKEFVATPTWITASGTNYWEFNTSGAPWAADTTYTITAKATDLAGNTSTTSSTFTYFSGGQGYTQLSLDLSSQTILQGGTLNATGKLTRLPDIGVSLSGLPVKLTITAPGGSTTIINTTTYDTYGHYIYNEVSGFTQKGTYAVQAAFEGNATLYSSSSDIKSILVGSSAGYAVIVEGKIQNNEGLASHNKTANRIYRKLTDRGFIDDNIYYFNYDTLQPNVDLIPTKGEIRYAIETWAKNKMNGSPAPLYIIMVDHGAKDAFYVDAETITPSDLNSWLNTLEAGLNATAIAEKKVVIIGSCYSGSFIDTVSKSGRVIVTSSAEEEESYKGPKEPDNVRSGEFFLEEFFKQLGRGYSIRQSFEDATGETEQFTRRGGSSSSNSGRYLDSAVQHPLLDDDGDGFGSNVLSDAFGDGLLADNIYLGTGVTYDVNSAANPAEVTGVTDTIHLNSSTSSAPLWAKVNDDGAASSVWMEIRPPSKTLTPTGGSTGQLEIDLTNEFMTLNGATGKWEKTYSSFTENGMYEVFYFARDTETGEISPVKRSLVYKNKAVNSAPSAFGLVSPIDGSEEKTVLMLDWQDSTDSDSVTYTVMISKDINFSTVDYIEEEIPHSATAVGLDAELEDLTTYYWKVIAVDPYGAKTESTQTWSFTTNNTNALPGIIEGHVYTASTGAAISGASVFSSGGGSVNSLPDGYFLMFVTAGQTTVIASASGYSSLQKTVTVSQGGSMMVNFALTAATSSYTISATAGTGGSISCSPTTVNSGSDSTCNISPNMGYFVADVLVDGVSKGAITSHTFTNVASDHAIHATFTLGNYGLGCPDGGAVQCLERTDGGSDTGNLVGNKPKGDLEYQFKAAVKDSTGNTPQYVKLYMAQRNIPVSGDFYAYDMACTGSYSTGATCTYETKLGPASVHKYYFEAKLADNSILRNPASGYITGPTVRLATGYNIVGAPRDINTANLGGLSAFGSSKVYRWVSDNAYTHLGYYVPVTNTSPAVPGEGYFSLNETTTLPGLDGYADVQEPSFTYQLRPGWNLISNPYAGNVKLGDIMVKKGATGTPVTWTQAVTDGWLTNAIYCYNGDDWGGTYSFESAGGAPDAILVPWIGYWIELNMTDADYYLVIPTSRP